MLTGGRFRFPSSRWRPPWLRPYQRPHPSHHILIGQQIPGLPVIPLAPKVNTKQCQHLQVPALFCDWLRVKLLIGVVQLEALLDECPTAVSQMSTRGCCSKLRYVCLGVPAGFQPLHGGFRDHFVETPEAKYCCESCRLVLCQPRQTECGHRFCHTCINDILRWDSVIHIHRKWLQQVCAKSANFWYLWPKHLHLCVVTCTGAHLDKCGMSNSYIIQHIASGTERLVRTQQSDPGSFSSEGRPLCSSELSVFTLLDLDLTHQIRFKVKGLKSCGFLYTSGFWTEHGLGRKRLFKTLK